MKKSVSKDEWLAKGLEALEAGGVDNIRIEKFARQLGIAKSGFYWHFKDRKDLLNELLDYWVRELTEVVTENLNLLALEPKERLTRTAEMILEYDLARYDIPIRQWALQDATAASVVRKVNRMRLDYVTSTFSELGFTGDDLEMRSMLFACYHSWESPMFKEISRKRRRKFIAKRIELLTKK